MRKWEGKCARGCWLPNSAVENIHLIRESNSLSLIYRQLKNIKIILWYFVIFWSKGDKNKKFLNMKTCTLYTHRLMDSVSPMCCLFSDGCGPTRLSGLSKSILGELYFSFCKCYVDKNVHIYNNLRLTIPDNWCENQVNHKIWR